MSGGWRASATSQWRNTTKPAALLQSTSGLLPQRGGLLLFPHTNKNQFTAQLGLDFILSSRFTFDIVQDSLYVLDADANAIFVAGLRDGVLRRKIGREGKGPLEFESLKDWTYTGSYFVAAESARLQILTRSLEYVSTVQARVSGPGTVGGTLSVGATQNHPMERPNHSCRHWVSRSLPSIPSCSAAVPLMDVCLQALTDCPMSLYLTTNTSTFTPSGSLVNVSRIMPKITRWGILAYPALVSVTCCRGFLC